ncbi:MAG: hypothetical protein MOGMAGMI_01807 [Candidatus Omnitrophica bacterium]|nr:hypothetical protein [Candidatus Omnitrophota bacterium]
MPQPDGSPEPTDINNKGADGGNDPSKNGTSEPTGFDPSSISDEDFSKVLEDRRLWNHPRIKSLNDRAKRADKYEKDLEENEKKKLEEEKRYQELAEKEKQRADELENRFKQESLNNRIALAASKHGVADPTDVLALLDRSGIQTDDQGNLTGVDEAVAKLLESKPYLKGDSTTPSLGSGANPTNPTAPAKRFTMSQIQDPKFYAEHKDEIVEAYKSGTIVDDLSGK